MFILVFVGVLLISHARAQLEHHSFSHSAWLSQDGDEFLLLWTPFEDEIIFEAQVSTLGYIGVGFSPNGGMAGADIVIGYVKEDNVFLKDYYATASETPRIDPSQDYSLVGGYENDTHTVIRFSRKWDTCDPKHDFVLNDDTVRVIWALGADDPADESSPKYHRDRRGVRSLMLKHQNSPIEVPPGTKVWDVRSSKFEIPEKLETLYWCQIFKVPKEEKKHHVIGFEPIVQKGNEAHVHHMILYDCSVPEGKAEIFEKAVGKIGTQCYSKNMPPSWSYCGNPLIGWAVGNEGHLLPPHVGIPIDDRHGGSSYLMLEIHYDNPNRKPDIVDNSGIRVLYTDELRKEEAGIIRMGINVSPFLIIPPNLEENIHAGHCTSECTKEVLPEEGINLVSGLLHSHLTGRAFKIRHIRDGVELANPLKDMNYDFNMQAQRNFKEELKVLPGDHFIVECNFNTSGRHAPTFGGFGTSEEMCIAYLIYYPRINFHQCMSNPSATAILGAFGRHKHAEVSLLEYLATFVNTQSDAVDQDIEAKFGNVLDSETPFKESKEFFLHHLFYKMEMQDPKNELPPQSKTFAGFLHDYDNWKNHRESYSKMAQFGEYSAFCQNKQDQNIIRMSPHKRYPKFVPLVEKPKKCTKLDEPESKINQSQETEINQSQETEINKSQETEINKSQETEINKSQETEINQSQETEINQSQETEINKSQETEINKSQETEINKSQETEINKSQETKRRLLQRNL